MEGPPPTILDIGPIRRKGGSQQQRKLERRLQRRHGVQGGGGGSGRCGGSLEAEDDEEAAQLAKVLELSMQEAGAPVSSVVHQAAAQVRGFGIWLSRD